MLAHLLLLNRPGGDGEQVKSLYTPLEALSLISPCEALRSPPPAPRGVTPVPPVPSVRSRHSHHRESHHRESHHRASRPRANPAIIPSNAPYPFEARMGQSSRRNRSPQPPINPPRRTAAPNDFDFGHHFGTIMIATMTVAAQAEQQERRRLEEQERQRRQQQRQ